MAEISQLLATFILNAIWQITAITALAHLCTKLLHRAPSRFSYGVWVAALGACLLIPTASVVLQHREATGRASEVAPTAQPDRAAEPGALAIPVSFHSLSRSVSFSPRILYALLWMYGIVLSCMLLGSPGLVIRRGVCVSWPTRIRCRLLLRGSWSIVRGRSHFPVFQCCALQNYRGRQRWGSDAPYSCSQRHSFSTLFLRTISSRRYRMN